MNCDLCDRPIGDDGGRFTREEAHLAAHAGPPLVAWEDADLRTSILGWIKLKFGHTQAQLDKAQTAIDRAGETVWNVCGGCAACVNSFIKRAKEKGM